MGNVSRLPHSWTGGFSDSMGSARATEDDIYYCYRLLLGRNPDENGLDSYTSLIRSQVISVNLLVEMFLSSPEFNQRRLLQQGREHEGFRLASLPDFNIYASPQDWAVGRCLLETGTHEPHVTAVMKTILKPRMVFVDVGANIGYFTLLARSITGKQGHVYAFEPNPRNCALLHLSLEANLFQDVQLFPFALADSPRLFVYDAQSSNGVITPFDGNAQALATRTVIRSVVLDEIVHLDRCDVLKIDIEGAEALAIRGGMKTLRAHHPVIFSEFSPPALENISRVSGGAYLQLLFDEGYTVSVITSSSALVACGQDAPTVIEHFNRARASHIDIVATPDGYGLPER